MGRQVWQSVLVGVGVALAPVAAWATTDFSTRAVGHTFRCGPYVMELPKDGPATLSRQGEPAILSAGRTRWKTHSGKLAFGPSVGVVKLSEYGATVSLKVGGQPTVCVKAQ